MKSPMRAVLLFALVAAFTVLIFGGAQIYSHKPPIPARVVDSTGAVVFTAADVEHGQRTYLARGGQHMGSIWGHGAYLAPDWSADAVHRIGLSTAALLVGMPEVAGFDEAALEALEPGERGRVEALVAAELHTNRYDAATDTLTLSAGQAAAFPVLVEYYSALFRDGNNAMSIPAGTLEDPADARAVTAFFTWTAWAAMTDRPDADHTYTANWPFDPLVGNGPLPSSLIWSIVSVMLLIVGVGAAIYFYLRTSKDEESPGELNPLPLPEPTPSQRATLPYFLVVAALFVVQILVGSLTGHYAVEGNHFFGFDTSDLLPYAASRTWHVQLSVFWIATAWLATGLFIGPFISGHEPKKQAMLVHVLLGALVVVVVGSLGGTWASIQGMFGSDGFWFGSQGYEYIELGRVWQVALIGGMLLWLWLVYRALKPALANELDKGGLTHLLLYASVSIPLFYSVGLFYTSGTHISVADYWRWWVVHLWVENFFEVFATVTLSFVLTRLGAVRPNVALRLVYYTVFLYLGAGVIGTFHHLYFTGTPLFITSLGATFSALEVVPLTLLGFEIFHNLDLIKRGGGEFAYRWPLMFFVAVAFWNLVGAGVFGFLINPPIVLYYIQGIDTTAIHSHGALFGVYGFLAIALMLFSMRHIVHPKAWSDRLLKYSFWLLNGGLASMMVFSLIPVGFYQMVQAVEHGIWYARSPAVTGSAFIQVFTWARVVPDLMFDAGALTLLVFVGRAIWLDRVYRRAGVPLFDESFDPAAGTAFAK